MKTPTVHNPTNFEPSNYEILDVFDNKRPAYYGQSMDLYEQELADWKANLEAIFGRDYIKKIHKCVHCGNGRVRWITAAGHNPTGEVVVFGCDCTARLGFANKFEFKLAQLKSKAEAGHAKMKVWLKRVAFLEAHPEMASALEQVKNPAHAQNSFVQDVLSKLNLYGELSDRQVAAVLKSLARDLQMAAQKAAQAEEVKGPAPEGLQTVTGTVLSKKLVEGFYGATLKMLVKLENNSRVWVTVPSKADVAPNDTITFKATFELSKDDKSFAFGKRPSVLKVTKAVAA